MLANHHSSWSCKTKPKEGTHTFSHHYYKGFEMAHSTLTSCQRRWNMEDLPDERQLNRNFSQCAYRAIDEHHCVHYPNNPPKKPKS